MHTLSDAPDSPPAEPANAIWNPDAAANWSLVFTPVFGAFIHMLNWKVLGQPERAASARRWLYASLGVLTIELFAAAINARLNNDSTFMQTLGLLYLIVWYFAAARGQAKAVRLRFGARYARKPWEYALLGALVAASVYVGMRALLTYIFIAFT